MNTPLEETVGTRFFAPARTAIESAKSKRSCPGFSDEDFILSGVGRVIASVSSGRDWIQQIKSWLGFSVTVSSFFQALRSKRRLAFSRDVDEHIRQQVDQTADPTWDPLAQHSELDGYEIYASDGHYEIAAAHTVPIEGKKYAPGYFYSLNLRSHGLALLDVARPELKKNKKEHDASALKRLSHDQLRLGAPTGTKVIHVYDPAAIDYIQWLKWKNKGIYLISREKANSRLQILGEKEIDRDDPRNIGVLSDQWVGTFSGVMIRRIRYQDPATGEIFSFITTQFTFPPGLIAFLYKLRWDIEKAFDEKKNKLQEKKAWAISDVARSQQALFVCMTHNLMVLLERQIERDEGIRDEKCLAKRRERIEQMKEKILQAGREPNPLVLSCTRITQRSLQFIRWLRIALAAPTSWQAEIDQLRPLMAKYLS